MSKRVMILFTMMLLLALNSCASEPQITSASPEQNSDCAQILAIAEKNRIPYRVTFGQEQHQQFLHMLTQDLHPQADAQLAERIEKEQLTQPREVLAQFTVEQAVADTEFLFDYLKYGYSGYGYFGGDAVFLPMKETILSQLKTDGQATDGIIKVEDYKELLSQHLSAVISDGHFSVNGLQLLEPKGMCYLSDKLHFQQDDTGYFALVDGEKAYLSGIAPDSVKNLVETGMETSLSLQLQEGHLAGLMKPTLDKDGRLAYVLCFSSSHQTDEVSIDLVLRKGAKLFTQTVQLSRVKWESYLHEMNRQLFEEDKIYRLYENEGVKIIEMRAFFSPSGDVSQLEQFAADALSYRDDDYLIVDLRRNGGGNSHYAMQWMKNFTGVEKGSFGLGWSATLLSQTVRSTIPESYGPEALAEFDSAKQTLSGAFPGWNAGTVTAPSVTIAPFPNQAKVFVITDLAVGSAAENLITFLQRTENVVFVGTNTWGVGTFGNVRPIYLPNSHMEVNSSYNLSILPDLAPFEGIGYQPDLWVDTNHAIDHVLALIANEQARK